MFHFCCYLQHFGHFLFESVRKKRNTDSTKVAQSVVNSSKNGKPIFNLEILLEPFSSKNLNFHSIEETSEKKPVLAWEREAR